MKYLIIGGAGYVGTELCEYLLNKKNELVIYDNFTYGDYINNNQNCLKIKADVTDYSKFKQVLSQEYDVIIHLACISNDPSYDLNPLLSKKVNFDSFNFFIENVKHKKTKLIYASSSSVYGLKDHENVTETEELLPMTDYSKYKALCEKAVLDNINDSFQAIILRPATVCGYSKRLRLDLVVNIFAYQAFYYNKIKLFGGNQLRPNVNIKDMIRIYYLLSNENFKNLNGQIYNFGYQNLSIKEIANLVLENKNIDHVEIEQIQSSDDRSYHISSNKIKQLGYNFNFNINDSIESLIIKFSEIKNPEDKIYHNIKMLKGL